MSIDVNGSWTRFWDGAHSVYVSPRHLDSHYRHIAGDIIRVLPHGRAAVLDHGCGEALHAGSIAASCGMLHLCEAAPTVRARLSERFADEPRIRVLAPGDVERLPEASLDLVVANSLVQYLTADDLAALLRVWRRALKREGRLIIADVITPDQTALTDAAALIRFSARHGFLGDALKGLARTFFSDYRRLRSELGLARYSEEALHDILRREGFSSRRLHPNFGYNRARLAVIASPID